MACTKACFCKPQQLSYRPIKDSDIQGCKSSHIPALNAGKQADTWGYVSCTDVTVPLPVMFCMLPFMHLNAVLMLLLTLGKGPYFPWVPKLAQ